MKSFLWNSDQKLNYILTQILNYGAKHDVLKISMKSIFKNKPCKGN